MWLYLLALQTDGVCRQVILTALRNYKVIVTDAILDEYRAVSARKKFSKIRNTLLDMINIIELSATKIPDMPIQNLTLPDIDDLIYLYAGINAKAKYLVTGNAKDFPSENCRGITVLSPKAFLLI